MTVGRHWSRSRRGEHTAKCSYCGAAWPSGSLRRDRSGNWACPDEGPGADALTCSELNAAGARGANRRRRPALAPVSVENNLPFYANPLTYYRTEIGNAEAVMSGSTAMVRALVVSFPLFSVQINSMWGYSGWFCRLVAPSTMTFIVRDGGGTLRTVTVAEPIQFSASRVQVWVFTHDGRTAKVYLGGSLVGSGTVSGYRPNLQPGGGGFEVVSALPTFPARGPSDHEVTYYHLVGSDSSSAFAQMDTTEKVSAWSQGVTANMVAARGDLVKPWKDASRWLAAEDANDVFWVDRIRNVQFTSVGDQGPLSYGQQAVTT